MMNKDVKNIIFTVHGIMSNQKENWTHTFEKYFNNDPHFTDWKFIRGNWGFLFFLFSISPFIRYFKIKQIQRELREIQNTYPDAVINVIAHSYGTMLIHQAVKRSDIDTDKEPIKIGKFITVGGIISEFEDFEDTLVEGQIEEIWNYCSRKDRVVKWQPFFGKCGYYGFVDNKKRKYESVPYIDLPIYNVRKDVHHSEYFSEDFPLFYEMWTRNLKL